VANCLIFYKVHVISEALQKLNQEGAEIGEQVVAALSPYFRQHINRFGRYQLDLTQPPPPLNYDIRVVTSKKKSAGFVASEALKKAKGQAEKDKISSSNEALLIGNSMDRMQNKLLQLERLIWLPWEAILVRMLS
jgi:hypothetical protein